MVKYRSRGIRPHDWRTRSPVRSNPSKDYQETPFTGQFEGLKQGIKLIKDYYVLFPVFFLYIGFIYAQGIIGSWIPQMSTGSLDMAPNPYKNAFLFLASITQKMSEIFQFGAICNC
jgi:hypothetical protein